MQGCTCWNLRDIILDTFIIPSLHLYIIFTKPYYQSRNVISIISSVSPNKDIWHIFQTWNTIMSNKIK